MHQRRLVGEKVRRRERGRGDTPAGCSCIESHHARKRQNNNNNNKRSPKKKEEGAAPQQKQEEEEKEERGDRGAVCHKK